MRIAPVIVAVPIGGSMFGYGKKEGTMAMVTIVLAIIPILVTLMVMPQLADQVATKFDGAGEVARWGSKYELLLAPGLALALGIGTVIMGLRQAQKFDKNDLLMARLTFKRYMRNGIVTGVVMLAASMYLLYSAATGSGFGF